MEKEFKELSAQLADEIKKMNDRSAELDKLVEKKADTKDVQGLSGELEELTKKYDTSLENVSKLSEALESLKQEIKDRKMGNEKKDDDITLMKKNWDNKEFLRELKSTNSKAQTFEIKTATTIDRATGLSGSSLATAVIVPERELGVGKAPIRYPKLLDLMSTGTIGSDRLTWVELSARNASAAPVADGGKYALSDMVYIQKTQPVERIGHYFKVQNTALDDWDFLMSEIFDEGIKGLEKALEAQVYSGTGVAPQLLGITATGIAPAYSDNTLSVITPGTADALRAAIMQIRKNEYQPNAILMNPGTAAQLEMDKTGDGIYLLPPFYDFNGLLIKGIPVIESTLVADGEVLVGDFSKIKLYFRKGIEVKIFEQNEDDALYDRKTITVSVRAANRIKAPEYGAFVYDEIGDIITAITAS